MTDFEASSRERMRTADFDLERIGPKFFGKLAGPVFLALAVSFKDPH